MGKAEKKEGGKVRRERAWGRGPVFVTLGRDFAAASRGQMQKIGFRFQVSGTRGQMTEAKYRCQVSAQPPA